MKSSPTSPLILPPKIEHILKHQSLFKEFRQLGCLFVISAVESFSEIVLLHLDKGHTRQDIFIVHDILQSVGITLRPSLVPYNSWMEGEAADVPQQNS